MHLRMRFERALNVVETFRRNVSTKIESLSGGFLPQLNCSCFSYFIIHNSQFRILGDFLFLILCTIQATQEHRYKLLHKRLWIALPSPLRYFNSGHL